MTMTHAKTDKVDELHQRLTAQVEALISSDDWRAMLDVAARLHRYSARNLLLILAQRPQGVTRLAGYRAWQSFGRQVRKGEQGIAILAPCVYRKRPVDETDAGDPPELGRILRGFRVAYVWDPLSRVFVKWRPRSRLSMRVQDARCSMGSPVLAVPETGRYPGCCGEGPARWVQDADPVHTKNASEVVSQYDRHGSAG